MILSEFVKHGYHIPLEGSTLVQMLANMLEKSKNLHLYVSCAKCLYYMFKTESDTCKLTRACSPDGTNETMVRWLADIWNGPCSEWHAMLQTNSPSEEFLTDEMGKKLSKKEVKEQFDRVKELVCYISGLFLFFTPIAELRRDMRGFHVGNLHLAFDFGDSTFFRQFLIEQCRHQLHINHTQEFYRLAQFLGKQLIRMLEAANAEMNWKTETVYTFVINILIYVFVSSLKVQAT